MVLNVGFWAKIEACGVRLCGLGKIGKKNLVKMRENLQKFTKMCEKLRKSAKISENLQKNEKKCAAFLVRSSEFVVMVVLRRAYRVLRGAHRAGCRRPR